MNFRGIAAICLSAWIATPAEAATLYYVSDVYRFSNYASGVMPTFTTGVINIDESKLPEGQGLAGLEILRRDDPEGTGPIWPSYVTSFSFQNQRETLFTSDDNPDASFMRFDGDGKLSDVRLMGFQSEEFSWRVDGFDGLATDNNYEFYGGRIYDDEDLPQWGAAIEEFLVDRGYRKGTEKFERLKASHEWYDGFSSTSPGEQPQKGRWYDSISEFVAAVSGRTREADLAAPSNFYGILPKKSACRAS